MMLSRQADEGAINLDGAEFDAEVVEDLVDTLAASKKRSAELFVTAASSAWTCALAVPWMTLRGLDLTGAQFGETVELDNWTITEWAKLGACFRRGLTTRQARFGGAVLFNGATFGPDTSFQEAVFDGDVYCQHVGFLAVDAGIPGMWWGATFGAAAMFEDCLVTDHVEFVNTRFGTPTVLGFYRVTEVPVRSMSTESHDQRWDEALRHRADVTFDGARWSGPAEVRLAAGDLRIRRSAVSHLLTLAAHDPEFRNLDRARRTMSDVAAVDARSIVLPGLDDPVDDTWPAMVELTDCSLLAPVVVGDVRVDRAHFVGSTGLEQMRFVGASPFAVTGGFMRRRQVIAEERLMRVPTAVEVGRDLPTRRPDEHRRVAAAIKAAEDVPDHVVDGYMKLRSVFLTRDEIDAVIAQQDEARMRLRLFAARVESTYRQLRVGLEASKAAPAAADFYYGELDARRRAASSGTRDFWLLGLYRWVGGYGVRAGPPLVWLLALIVCTWLALWQFTDAFVRDSLDGAALNNTLDGYRLDKPWDSLAFVVRNSISFVSAPAAGLTAAGTFLFVFERYTAVTLLALTAFAVRSRIAR
jgi:hypothetical protein